MEERVGRLTNHRNRFHGQGNGMVWESKPWGGAQEIMALGVVLLCNFGQVPSIMQI